MNVFKSIKRRYSSIRQKNIFAIMFFYFILEPLFVGMFFCFMIGVLTRGNGMVILISPFILIPLSCVLWVLLDNRDIDFLKRAKVALEWNQAIASSVSLFVAIYIIVVPESDLGFLRYLFSPASGDDGITSRDAANLVFLTLSFPFVISFTFAKATIEHILFRKEKSQSYTDEINKSKSVS
ncbi:hypothetical protein [Paenibacillus sp. NPDC093718]|uniref:hypothetical protein n=1 Tax=Paenibacillus sp. NPDC093718 TaxID=3390601 RepID=UPI003D02DAE1